MASIVVDNAVNRQGLYTRTMFTFATLPAATACQGQEFFITDSTASPDTGYGQVPTGGGTFQARVVSDGTVFRLSRGLQD